MEVILEHAYAPRLHMKNSITYLCLSKQPRSSNSAFQTVLPLFLGGESQYYSLYKEQRKCKVHKPCQSLCYLELLKTPSREKSSLRGHQTWKTFGEPKASHTGVIRIPRSIGRSSRRGILVMYDELASAYRLVHIERFTRSDSRLKGNRQASNRFSE